MPKEEQQHNARESPGEAPNPALPDKDSIIEEESFTSPKGKRYRVLKSNLTDAYDEPSEHEEQHPKPGRKP